MSELSEAVERLRSMPVGAHRSIQDIVIEAYLAEHPADDDTTRLAELGVGRGEKSTKQGKLI